MSDERPVAGNSGILYRLSDYPGIFIRLLIDGLDFTFLILLGAAIFISADMIIEDELTFSRLLLAYMLFGFAYLGPWKANGRPTLGYLICRVKVVNAAGGPITFWQASARALFLFFGPANFLIDLFWLYGETPRQALRDKATGTYLIRKNAQEAGRGRIIAKVYHVMGYHLRMEEIERSGNG